MTEPVGLADLKWSADLPAFSGHYFVAWPVGHFHDYIEVTESGEVFSVDGDFNKYVYEQGDGTQFFGPLMIPEPPVLPQPEVILAANQIDGDVSNV